MFEPGMKMFRVRCTRQGEETHVVVLPAFDTDDALERAKAQAAQLMDLGATEDNPFENLEGLEVSVRPLH